jgi:hypothetical protein
MIRSAFGIAALLLTLCFATSPAMAQASIDLSARTDAAAIPAGTTAQRPTSPVINGMIRYNSTLGGLEAYVNGSWGAITGPPTLSFINLTGQDTSKTLSSNTILVTGFAGAQTISISGSGTPQFSIGGAAFSNTPTTITSGQTLQLQLTSPATASTTYTATLTIGSTTTTWSVTTASKIVLYANGTNSYANFGAAYGGGRAGADAYCQAAQPGGLTCNGTIHAFVSFNLDTIASFPTNYGTPAGITIYWYNRGTGTSTVQIQTNWANLFGGTILNSNSVGLGSVTALWTGSTSSGALSYNCAGWTTNSSGGYGEYGFNATDGTWLDYGTATCNGSAMVLCVCVQD